MILKVRRKIKLLLIKLMMITGVKSYKNEELFDKYIGAGITFYLYIFKK